MVRMKNSLVTLNSNITVKLVLAVVAIMFFGLLVTFLIDGEPSYAGSTDPVFVVRHRTWLGKANGYVSIIEHMPTGRCYTLPTNGTMMETTADMCKGK